MKTEEEIRKTLDELKKRGSLSANMNYEKHGAIKVLEWVLGEHKIKPIIGYRL